ncbi:ribonuclease H-like domain-containing protein, partial [Tanacetum coccineum]
VAFRKSTCIVRDLQGNDLLTGTHGSDLDTIALQESSSPTIICFMAKASPTQAWLWHHRLSHLNFDTIKLSKNDIMNGLLLGIKCGEYDMWKLRIEQYFQVQYYTLWDVIENGNSFKLATQATTNTDGTLTTLIPGPLSILGENISQEDLNLKFLRSVPYEWNTHVVVWRNKPDLDTMRFDDLYNNFKIVKQEVKGTGSSSSSSQNMAFVSPPSSTNEVNTAYGVSTANTQVSPASTQVSTASTQMSTANLSGDTIYAFLVSQPNRCQLVYEDLEQIHEDDIEEMDLKWQLALLNMKTRRFFQKTGRKIIINGSDTGGYDKSKEECFNCHKLGYFVRECRGFRNQDSRNRNQDKTSYKAMLCWELEASIT